MSVPLPRTAARRRWGLARSGSPSARYARPVHSAVYELVGSSSAATGYEYCIDTTDNDACDASWVSVGGATSAIPTGLAEWTIYSWQVRATNTQGNTPADGGQWWNFITTPLLLEDGFDAGDLAAWSGTLP